MSSYTQNISLEIFWKYYRVRTEKLYRIKVNKSQNIFGKYFLGGTVFFKAKNLTVNTWRSWPNICSLICDTYSQSSNPALLLNVHVKYFLWLFAFFDDLNLCPHKRWSTIILSDWRISISLGSQLPGLTHLAWKL